MKTRNMGSCLSVVGHRLRQSSKFILQYLFTSSEEMELKLAYLELRIGLLTKHVELLIKTGQ